MSQFTNFQTPGNDLDHMKELASGLLSLFNSDKIFAFNLGVAIDNGNTMEVHSFCLNNDKEGDFPPFPEQELKNFMEELFILLQSKILELSIKTNLA